MNETAFHTSLRLENFTVFEDVSIQFSPGINAIIGTNGSGKTHLLKAIYAFQASARKSGTFGLDQKYRGVFQVQDTASLVRQSSDQPLEAKLEGAYGNSDWFIKFNRKVDGRTLSSTGFPIQTSQIGKQIVSEMPEAIFIPAVDMMAHTKGFISTYERYEIDFDETHKDLVVQLLSPSEREIEGEYARILSELHQTVGGQVYLEAERFFFKSEYAILEMPLMAEGFRKIATLMRLIQVGALKPGSTLFWDEPEVNINPTLMDELVKALLLISRSGVQIFFTTHSYVILKELDLQSTSSDKLTYHTLSNEGGATKAGSFYSFADLTPNAILEQYGNLYDREIMKATGRKKK